MSGRKGIMLCYPFEEKRLARWEPPYIVQPKLDGERCRYVPYKHEGGHSSLLLSSEENVFFSVPHIKDFLDGIKCTFELDGELYCHGMPFEEIHSRVSRQVNYHQDFKDIEYHIFDIVVPGLNQAERIEFLKVLKDVLSSYNNSPVKIVPWYPASSLDELLGIYDGILEQGYEGIVVREKNGYYVPKRSTSLMKFKPKKSDTYDIIGYTEEISINGEPKGRLGALTCTSDDGSVFNVGTGFNHADRKHFWDTRETLIGKKATVAYQHITHGGGVPRFPVFVRVEE